MICALAIALVPAVLGPSAHAQSSPRSGSWYRYQGEPSSYDQHDNQHVNCGPTSVAMAIQYSLNVSVPIRHIRAFIGKHKRYTDLSDLTKSLDRWGVQYNSNILDANSLKAVIDRGHVAIVGLDMRQVSRGADVNGASTDPSLRTGRYETTADLHWIVVKGLSSDGQYFLVYDGNVWGGPTSRTYW